MGLFSIFTGFVYNDFFSKSLNLMGSRWLVNAPISEMLSQQILTLSPKTDAYVNPYPFGIDPIWMVSLLLIIFF